MRLVVFERPSKLVNALVLHHPNFRAKLFDEVLVMTDNEDSSTETLKSRGEGLYGLHIEMTRFSG